jgi:hypothetical protein
MQMPSENQQSVARLHFGKSEEAGWVHNRDVAITKRFPKMKSQMSAAESHLTAVEPHDERGRVGVRLALNVPIEVMRTGEREKRAAVRNLYTFEKPYAVGNSAGCCLFSCPRTSETRLSNRDSRVKS